VYHEDEGIKPPISLFTTSTSTSTGCARCVRQYSFFLAFHLDVTTSIVYGISKPVYKEKKMTVDSLAHNTQFNTLELALCPVQKTLGTLYFRELAEYTALEGLVVFPPHTHGIDHTKTCKIAFKLGLKGFILFGEVFL
jgi:hypothetical protein